MVADQGSWNWFGSFFLPSLAPQIKNVLFGARLLKEKGLECLVRAKHELEKQGLSFTLNIAGIIDNDVSSVILLAKWSTGKFPRYQLVR